MAQGPEFKPQCRKKKKVLRKEDNGKETQSKKAHTLKLLQLGAVVHTYNLSYLGSGDREDFSSIPAGAKS
jgi:hypothetical protein